MFVKKIEKYRMFLFFVCWHICCSSILGDICLLLLWFEVRSKVVVGIISMVRRRRWARFCLWTNERLLALSHILSQSFYNPSVCGHNIWREWMFALFVIHNWGFLEEAILPKCFSGNSYSPPKVTWDMFPWWVLNWNAMSLLAGT